MTLLPDAVKRWIAEFQDARVFRLKSQIATSRAMLVKNARTIARMRARLDDLNRHKAVIDLKHCPKCGASISGNANDAKPGT